MHCNSPHPPPRLPALCLSGGGYRATLFHTGVIRALNELKMLHRFKVIDGVSGGAIAVATLALEWPNLVQDEVTDTLEGLKNFENKTLNLSQETIDILAILKGRFSVRLWNAPGITENFGIKIKRATKK